LKARGFLAVYVNGIADRLGFPAGKLDLPHLAVFYIEGVVRGLLAPCPASAAHLGLIGQACEQRRPQNVDVATLNHDRVIDEFLREHGIAYDDGFERDPTEGFRRFCPSVYERSGRDKRARVLKLHGAANWNWRADRPSKGATVYHLGAVTDYHSASPPFDGEPADITFPIQIGTYNKMTNYTLFRSLTDLQCQFLRWLDSSDLIVVAGYSFGDAGINARVQNWAVESPGRRMVLIDPCLDDAKRGWTISQNSHWADWQTAKIVVPLRKRIDDVTWAEVLSVI
jgi:hypothetical protein